MTYLEFLEDNDFSQLKISIAKNKYIFESIVTSKNLSLDVANFC